MISHGVDSSELPVREAEHVAEPKLDEEGEEDDEEETKQTQDEQLALIDHEDEATSDGEDCELHVYERRFDTRGEQIDLRVGTKSKFEPQRRRSHRACLVLTRIYDGDHDRSPFLTDLDIQSRHIIEALRNVIGNYPGVHFDSKQVTFTEPAKCLFHYRDELRHYAETSNNSKLKAHMHLCLRYVDKALDREIRISESIASSISVPPEVEYRHLWTLFKPGCLVYHKHTVQEMLFRLRSVRLNNDTDKKMLILTMDYVRHSGSELGFISNVVEIESYDGCKPLHQMLAIPLHFHPEEERIRRDLLQRGRRFLSLAGINHCFYDGFAYLCDPISPQHYTNTHTNVKQRIMLDPEGYSRYVQDSSRSFVVGSKTYETGKEAISDLSDEDVMTCSGLLLGFSLELKRWGLFMTLNVTEVAFNDKAFDALVLPEKNKKLISSLSEREKGQEHDDFDDLIQGKGKGLVFLLHGPPGVGKTYTAESIADHTRRPLLKISSGELFGDAGLIEQRLSDLFLLSTRWNGVLLLDEADVFMQVRSLHDLATNSLVSTLLRVLEYYEGILFLTTNRIENIDYAFKSRIHLAIAYPPLSADARRELWSNFVMRANHGQSPDWLTADFLDDLAREKVNGREIKNIVRTGYALARNAKRDLESADLMQSLDALKQFDIVFSKSTEEKVALETSE